MNIIDYIEGVIFGWALYFSVLLIESIIERAIMFNKKIDKDPYQRFSTVGSSWLIAIVVVLWGTFYTLNKF
jgi:hypothetical protein